jgi:hypothetical protein
LRGIQQRYPEPYILWWAAHGTKPAYGIKLLINRVRNASGVISRLQRLYWLVIHIHRDSLFDAALSATVAALTGCYASGRTFPESSIEVPIDRFLAQIQYRVQNGELELKVLQSVPSFELVMNKTC